MLTSMHLNLNFQKYAKLEEEVSNFVIQKYLASEQTRANFHLTQVDIMQARDLHIVIRLDAKKHFLDERKNIMAKEFDGLIYEPIFEPGGEGYDASWNTIYQSKTVFIYYSVERPIEEVIELHKHLNGKEA